MLGDNGSPVVRGALHAALLDDAPPPPRYVGLLGERGRVEVGSSEEEEGVVVCPAALAFFIVVAPKAKNRRAGAAAVAAADDELLAESTLVEVVELVDEALAVRGAAAGAGGFATLAVFAVFMRWPNNVDARDDDDDEGPAAAAPLALPPAFPTTLFLPMRAEENDERDLRAAVAVMAARRPLGRGAVVAEAGA